MLYINVISLRLILYLRGMYVYVYIYKNNIIGLGINDKYSNI